MYFFFFFKQKTAYEMRISDWSSDVCSSDLGLTAPPCLRRVAALSGDVNDIAVIDRALAALFPDDAGLQRWLRLAAEKVDRKSVVWGTSVSVRVDLGGRRIIKIQNIII